MTGSGSLDKAPGWGRGGEAVGMQRWAVLGVSGFNLQGWNTGGKVSWKLLKGMYFLDKHFLDCCGPLINLQSSEKV